eukprot:360841-Chlamydomonas_euryale.AAC.1
MSASGYAMQWACKQAVQGSESHSGSARGPSRGVRHRVGLHAGRPGECATEWACTRAVQGSASACGPP